jgi:hypothetical protein
MDTFSESAVELKRRNEPLSYGGKLDEPANIQMEPTRPLVCAITALRGAAHLKRWADKELSDDCTSDVGPMLARNVLCAIPSVGAM